MTEPLKYGHMHIQETEIVSPTHGVWMLPGFGNTGVVETSEGLVLLDMPTKAYIRKTMTMLREVSHAPVTTVFLSHGHFDHAFNLNVLFEEASTLGSSPPTVIAHRLVLKRFQKYMMLHGYHEHINRIQFNFKSDDPPAFSLPDRNPDIIFDHSISMSIGGLDFHAYHALGETDDALWVWVPEKRTVFAGDLVVYSVPNVGNPFKVQRFALEWAEGLEAILAKEPEILIPGHGRVIQGAQKIRETLLKISRLLRYLHDEVVKRLNQGMWYEDIIHDISVPEGMLDTEFLAPRYGCPEFIIHGVLREYTGWYDGNPSHLFPPKRSERDREIAKLIGKEKLMKHAYQLQEAGNTAMALQFVDLTLACTLEDQEEKSMHALKAELLRKHRHHASSFIAKSIYQSAQEKEEAFLGLK